MKQKLLITLMIFLFTSLLLVILSPEPVNSLIEFYRGPFSTRYSFGSFLSIASLLVIAGTGVSISFRGGQFNLGGEGQVYSGAVAALITALMLPALPGFLGKPLLLLISLLAGAAIAASSGWLRYHFSIHELISSYLISSGLVYFCDYLITGPLRDHESFLLATPRIPEAYHLMRILPPSPLHTGALIALAVVFITALWLARGVSGYRLRIFGENPSFARFGGIRERTYRILPITISGALYGLAGGIALLGVQHRGIQGFTAGIGWNGIAVALIAGLSPGMTIYAALLMAYIQIGIAAAMAGASVTYDLGLIVQGMIMLTVTLRIFGSRKREELL